MKKNNKENEGFLTNEERMTFLTDSLIGVLKGEYDEQAMREERINRVDIS